MRPLPARADAKTNILIIRKLSPADLQSRHLLRFFICGESRESNREDVARSRTSSSLLPIFPVQFNCSSSVVLTPDADWRPEAHSTTIPVSRGTVRLGTGFARYAGQRELFDQPAPGRVPLIRAKNLSSDGGLRLHRDCAYIGKAGPMFSKKAVVRRGEILFVRVGVGCYDWAAVVPRGIVAQADDWIHVLTPKAGVSTRAAAGWLDSAEGCADVRRLAKGASTTSVSKTALAVLRIPARLSMMGTRKQQT